MVAPSWAWTRASAAMSSGGVRTWKGKGHPGEEAGEPIEVGRGAAQDGLPAFPGQGHEEGRGPAL